MTTAEEILARTTTPETEPHIVINPDRTVTVPPELRMIAVQFDRDIETVTFDCPRYWDEHDLSKMKVFIEYRRGDGETGEYHCKDVVVDAIDSSIMHFTWTISEFLTQVVGKISFWVCAKNVDYDDNLINRWSSFKNEEMRVEEGINASEEIAQLYPDVLMSVLMRLDNLVRASSGDGPPTTATVGAIGSMYMDRLSTKTYKCVSITDGVYTWVCMDAEVDYSRLGDYLPKISETWTFTLADGSTVTREVYMK